MSRGALVLAAVLFIGALLPHALAGGTLDAGVAEVRMEDRFGDACSHPVGGFCAFHVENGTSPGDLYVDVAQRIRYIGVATNLTAIRDATGARWLLPDRSLVVDGRVLYVEYPYLRMATETWNGTPHDTPVSDKYSLNLSSEAITLRYYGLTPTNASLGQREFVMPYSQGEGIGYEHTGPLNTPGGNSTDGYLDQSRPGYCMFMKVEGCQEKADGVVDLVQASAPNVNVGFDFYRAEVATDPALLDRSPSAHRQPPAPAVLAKPPLPSPPDEPSPSDEAAAPAPQPQDPPPDVAPAPRGPGRDAAVSQLLSQRAAAPTAPLALVVGAAATLAALVVGVLLRLYSRFTGRSDLLRQAARQEILRLVTESPGVSLGALAARTGTARTTVDYHVRMLNRARLLRVLRADGRTYIYLAERHEGKPPLRAVPVKRQVVEVLGNAREGLSRRDLANLLTWVPTRTRNHAIRQLVVSGAIEASGDGPKARLRLKEPA